MNILSIKNRLKLMLFAITLGLCSAIGGAPAFADLLITPWQVVMEERDRTAQIILVNTGSEDATYRLEWAQYEQSPEHGGYIDSDMESGDLFLQNMAVFTPRQITLAPDEKQTIRVAIRRPADLAAGEYKSHLRFGIIQVPKVPTKDPSLGDQFKVAATLAISYSIPIIYRVGEHDVSINIGEPKPGVNEKTGALLFKVPVERSGIHGVIGQIDIYHTPNGGEEVILVSLGNSNIYPEVTSREFTIPTPVNGLPPGTLRVVFLKAEATLKKDYVVLDEKTFPIGN